MIKILKKLIGAKKCRLVEYKPKIIKPKKIFKIKFCENLHKTMLPRPDNKPRINIMNINKNKISKYIVFLLLYLRIISKCNFEYMKYLKSINYLNFKFKYYALILHYD